MPTKNEQIAASEAKRWLSSLPRDIQLKTLSTQILKEQWLAKNPTELSIAFLDSLVLNLISRFTIPQSYKHFAKSKALLESLIVNTEIILLFLITF